MRIVMPAAEGKTKFGVLLDTVQREPVTISKMGGQVAVKISIEEYERHEALKLERLQSEIQIGLDQLDNGHSADGREFMKSLIERPD